jgi:endonuclease-3 related protein
VATRTAAVSRIYDLLDDAFGHEHWHWMPEHATPIEVMVGAVLVQHTTWQSAERALNNLRTAGLLDAAALISAHDAAVVDAIKVCGTPLVKVRRLRALATTIEATGGMAAILAMPPNELRQRLLDTHGIGPETADAILLYAAGRRTFVVDTYTRRVFRRIGLGPVEDGYEDWRSFFLAALVRAGEHTLRRYHAWIVLHAKTVCRIKPRCTACILVDLCDAGRSTGAVALR